MKTLIFVILLLMAAGFISANQDNHLETAHHWNLTVPHITLPEEPKAEVEFPHTKGFIDTMQPTPWELLDKKIESKKCPGVEIIEWRPTAGQETSTGPNKLTIQAVEEACQLALNNFPIFLETENRVAKPKPWDFHIAVCIMPPGLEYRSLNDVIHRFRDRETYYTWDHKVALLEGYTNHETRQIYIGNDVIDGTGKLTPHFKLVFVHELGHALSLYYGILESHPKGRRVQEDEKLVHHFTMYLNLGI